MKDLEIIQAIDYILKEVDHKYKDTAKIYISEENEEILNDKVINSLKDEYAIDIRNKKEDIYYEWEYKCSEYYKWIYNINTLILFDYKRKLLWKTQKSIINSHTLEGLARFIWDWWNAQSIIDVLHECEVPDYLVVYPNTKWRMVYDIFRVLATSIYAQWHELLFTIIEEFLNPIRFSSIQSWIEFQNNYSESLAYDWFEIVKWKILPLKDKKDMYDIYYENKQWKIIDTGEYDNIKGIISNTEYKKITLLKWKDWKINFVEWERHIERKWNKYIDVEKNFPYSDIKTSVHNGKGGTYIVNEKIRLKKEDK